MVRHAVLTAPILACVVLAPPATSGDARREPRSAAGGRGRTALRFDGVDDTVHIAHTAALDFRREGVTMACWVRLEPEARGVIANKWKGGEEDLLLRVLPDRRLELHLFLEGRASVRLVTGSPLPARRWFHLAGVYDRQALRSR